LSKYSRRERNRARKHQIEIARVVKSLAEINGFERLEKEGMYSRSRVWNRRVMRTDWRSIMRRVDGSVELPPQHTSETCSRCGWANKDLNGGIFRCGSCGLTIDRHTSSSEPSAPPLSGSTHPPVVVGRYYPTNLSGGELPPSSGRGLWRR